MKSGIYHIVCAASGRIYVGRSENLEIRWNQHWKMLNDGMHHNKALQAAFTENGGGLLSFRVRDFCHPLFLAYAEALEIQTLASAGAVLFNERVSEVIDTSGNLRLHSSMVEVLYGICRASNKSPHSVLESLVWEKARKDHPNCFTHTVQIPMKMIEPQPIRQLKDGELEQLWEKRNK